MKKLIEVRRGHLVSDSAKLIKTESKITYERPSSGGNKQPVIWDLWEITE